MCRRTGRFGLRFCNGVGQNALITCAGSQKLEKATDIRLAKITGAALMIRTLTLVLPMIGSAACADQSLPSVIDRC